jgi:hypothetical protein
VAALDSDVVFASLSGIGLTLDDDWFIGAVIGLSRPGSDA